REPRLPQGVHAAVREGLAMKALLAALSVLAGGALAQGGKPAPVTMTLNWFPQAEQGGYFTALVEKIYEKHGLDVTLKPGGPHVNKSYVLVGLGENQALRYGFPCLAARQAVGCAGLPIR